MSVDERAAKRELESEILARVVAGDVDAFEYFVVTYQKRITRFVYTLLRDPADADGVTQDVFVKAFRALPEFKGESAFETWLTRIAINTVRDHIRRRKPVVSFSELRDRAGRRRPGASGRVRSGRRHVARAGPPVAGHPAPDRRRARGAVAAPARGLRHETLRGKVHRRDRGSHRPRRGHDQVPSVSRGPQAARAPGGPPMSAERATSPPTRSSSACSRWTTAPAAVPAHLATCAACQERVAALREAWLLDRGAVSGAVDDLPSGFWEAQAAATMASVRAGAPVGAPAPEVGVFPSRMRGILRHPVLALSSLAAALLLVGGLSLLRSGSTAPAVQTATATTSESGRRLLPP